MPTHHGGLTYREISRVSGRLTVQGCGRAVFLQPDRHLRVGSPEAPFQQTPTIAISAQERFAFGVKGAVFQVFAIPGFLVVDLAAIRPQRDYSRERPWAGDSQMLHAKNNLLPEIGFHRDAQDVHDGFAFRSARCRRVGSLRVGGGRGETTECDQEWFFHKV